MENAKQSVSLPASVDMEWDVGTLLSPPEGNMSVDSCPPLFKELFSIIYQFTSLFKTTVHYLIPILQ